MMWSTSKSFNDNDASKTPIPFTAYPKLISLLIQYEKFTIGFFNNFDSKLSMIASLQTL